LLLDESEHDSGLAATGGQGRPEIRILSVDFGVSDCGQDEVVVSSLDAIYQQPGEPVSLIA
jgi:hypothetical protein